LDLVAKVLGMAGTLAGWGARMVRGFQRFVRLMRAEVLLPAV